MMFCLLDQVHCLRLNFGGMPQHSNHRITGDAIRIFPGTYCDPSYVFGCIIKILLVFCLHRSFVFGGSISSCCWDTV